MTYSEDADRVKQRYVDQIDAARYELRDYNYPNQSLAGCVRSLRLALEHAESELKVLKQKIENMEETL